MTATPNRWHHGDAYERYMGRWSRQVASEFVAWIDVAPRSRWLDIGCGTGALTSVILASAKPASVYGIDPSDGFLTLAREQVTDPRVAFLAGRATAIPLDSASMDAVVGALMLNFIPSPQDAVVEMTRVAHPGAIVAAYVWDYAEGMQLMRRFWDAAIVLDPAAVERDEGQRPGSICSPPALERLWQSAGLRDIAVCPVDIPTRFRDFEDYWSPFLGAQGSAPAYVASLSPDQRDMLRDGLRATLPTEPDGSIHLTARAWAVRGTR